MKKTFTFISILCALAVAGIGAQTFSSVASRPVSLAGEMAAQLSSRMKGGDCNFVSKADQVFFLFPQQPKLNPKFWLRGVTNILATSLGRYDPYWSVGQPSSWIVGACLSPVSPRHCIATTHVTGGALDTHLWLLPDISSKVSGMRTGDYAKSKPALAVLMHHASQNTPYITTFTAALLNCHAWCGHSTNQLEFGNYSVGYSQINGDSSSPILAVINNEAVFICQVYGPMSGPAPGMETNAVNTAMANLSKNNGAPAYQLTPYDVSGFPDQ